MRVGMLHLTDIHFGQSKMDDLFPDLRTELWEDLEWLHERSGPWDFVVVTGDIAQTGAANEFALADRFFDDLCTRVRRWSGIVPQLVCVPGNHDLQRLGDGQTEDALRSWWTTPGILERVWDTASPERAAIDVAFANYEAWWRRRWGTRSIRPGSGPGSFAWSHDLHAMRVGFVGINTALLHLSDANTEATLAGSVRQIRPACDHDVAAWTRSNQLNILLSHHPTAWLTPAQKEAWDTEIGRHFNLHLFGHMHVSESRWIAEAGQEMRGSMQGASLFGLETFGDNVAREHGYSAIECNVSRDFVSTQIWPRRAHKIGRTNIWRLGPDTAFALDRGTQAFRHPIPARDPQVPDVLFRDVDFRSYLSSASHLLLVTNYADSWLGEMRDAIVPMLRAGGDLTVVLPDASQSEQQWVLAKRYQDRQRVYERVAHTLEQLRHLEIAADARGRVSARLSQLPLSYWALRIDQHSLFLSPFQHRRTGRVDAPVFKVRLLGIRSQFWRDEMSAVLDSSRATPLNTQFSGAYREEDHLRSEFREVLINGVGLVDALARIPLVEDATAPEQLVDAVASAAGAARTPADVFWWLFIRGLLEITDIDDDDWELDNWRAAARHTRISKRGLWVIRQFRDESAQAPS